MKKLMIVLAFAAFAACSKSKPAATTAKQPDSKMEPAAGDATKTEGDKKPEGDAKPEGGADPCAAPK